MPLKRADDSQNNKPIDINASGDRRKSERSEQTLREALTQGDLVQRRYAARDLAKYPQSAEHLVGAIESEQDNSVRQAIFDSLSVFDGKVVVDAIIPLLKSEEASIRNAAIEVLQGFPTEVGPKIATLLHDPDTDVRIFAIDVLQQLAHPSAPDWLLEVIRDEEHPNVVGTALDRLVEIARPDMKNALIEVKQRFNEQPYIGFAADLCIQRLDC